MKRKKDLCARWHWDADPRTVALGLTLFVALAVVFLSRFFIALTVLIRFETMPSQPSARDEFIVAAIAHNLETLAKQTCRVAAEPGRAPCLRV
jgi:hypothetical protein